MGTSPGRQRGALTLRRPASRRRSLPHKARFYSALGVVYGDRGTRPLYTLKIAHEAAGGASVDVPLGLLSLITWTLVIVTSVKYVALVMVARFLCIAALGVLAIVSHHLALPVQREPRSTRCAGALLPRRSRI